MSSAAATASEREELRFGSGDSDCAAWLYRPPEAAEGVPCVVMANGFSLTRHDGLALYAERFAAAGLAVLAFDHRYLGDSGGEPRQRFRAAEQRRDWMSAIAHARGLAGVDPRRIVLWGYSFAGGHVASLIAGRQRPAAAILLCPFLNGLARVLATRPSVAARIIPRALLDLAGHHTTIPVTGPEGSVGAMTFAGEGDGFAASIGPGSPWRNEISPGVLATVALHRPLRGAAAVECPLWVGLGERDITVDRRSVELFAERAPRGELHRYDVDHFAPLTEPTAGEIAADQVEFLVRAGLASPRPLAAPAPG